MKYWSISGGKMTKPEKKVIALALIGGVIVFFISKNRLNEYDDQQIRFFEQNGF